MRCGGNVVVAFRLLGLLGWIVAAESDATTGVVAVFELTWVSPLQTGDVFDPSTLGGSNSNHILDQFALAVNQALYQKNVASALLVGDTTLAVPVNASATPSLTATSCTTLTQGSFYNFVPEDTGVCQVCANCAGVYVAQPCGAHTDAVCVSQCAAGSYQSTGGWRVRAPARGECANCSAGTYTNRTGQSTCTACPAGQIAPWGGATACEACASGTQASDDRLLCLTVRGQFHIYGLCARVRSVAFLKARFK
jgi:hypothetical protein